MTRHPALYPALIVLIGIGFLHNLWLGSGIVYSEKSDIIAQLTSLKIIGQRSMADEGTYPLWDPSTNCGSPAHANPGGMFTFPLHGSYLFFPIDRATNLAVLPAMLCSGLTMYLFARRVVRHPASALVCGVAYMLCHRSLSMIHAGWLQGMVMYALTPLLFWSLDRLIERPSRIRIGFLAVAFALGLMQGQLQLFYYTSLAAIVFLAYKFFVIDRRARLPTATALLAGAALGILLAAPDLLPRLELASLSTRLRFDYAFFLDRQVGWSDLKTLFDPLDAGGTRDEYWERNFYFGLTLFPLCLFALVKNWRLSAPLAVAAAATFLLCFDSPVLRFLFDAVPGFNLFRISSRILHVTQFIVVLLAGRGADAVLSAWPDVRRGRMVFGLALLCILLDAAIRFQTRLITRPLSESFPAAPFHDVIRRSPTNGRTVAVDRLAVPYGQAGYFGIDMANGYASLNLKHYMDYFSVLKTGEPRRIPLRPAVWTDLESVARPDMLRALDVRYIVANEEYPFERIGYEKVASYENVSVFNFYEGVVQVSVHLWRDTSPLGPAYFAASLRRVETEGASLDAVASTSARDACILGLDRQTPPTDFSGGRAEMVRRGYNIYMYDIESRGNNFLILSQIWYPGWKARLDGRDINLYRTNHTLLGCFVPPGRHSLELTMTSPKLRQGIILCVVGLSILAWLFYRRRIPSSSL